MVTSQESTSQVLKEHKQGEQWRQGATTIIIWHQRPTQQVEKNPRATHQGKQNQYDPHDYGIDAKETAKSRTNASQNAIGC